MSRQAQLEWWQPDVADEPGEHDERPATVSDESGSPVPFWALMLFTFILLVAPQSYVPALASLRIALLAALLGIGSYLFDKFRRGQPIMMRAREMWIAIGLAGWAVLTVPFSYWPGGSVALLFGDYFKTLVMFWLLSHTVTTRPRLRRIAWGLGLMAVPMTLTALQNYRSGDVFVQGEFTRVLGNEGGFSGNPNDLALMLNLILPVSVGLFLSSRTFLTRTAALASIALIVTGVILTYSRAGFLTLATIFVMYLWKLRDRPERSWAWAALAVALLCVPLLPSAYVDRLSTITDIEADQSGSSKERWKNMVAAVDHLTENPLVGAGPGMNILAMNEEGGAKWTAVHNVYLEFAVDLGLPGLALFLLLLGGCISRAASVQRRVASIPALHDLFCLAEGIQVSLVAFVVAGFFHPVAYHFYFYYMAGLAVAIGAVADQETGPGASILAGAGAGEGKHA